MNKNWRLKIDQLDKDNVILLDESLNITLPASMVPDGVAIGDQLILTLNTKTEYELNQHNNARDVLQELLKEK
jgi:hypothetical protein